MSRRVSLTLVILQFLALLAAAYQLGTTLHRLAPEGIPANALFDAAPGNAAPIYIAQLAGQSGRPVLIAASIVWLLSRLRRLIAPSIAAP